MWLSSKYGRAQLFGHLKTDPIQGPNGLDKNYCDHSHLFISKEVVETGVLLKIQGGALREHPTVKRNYGGLWKSG